MDTHSLSTRGKKMDRAQGPDTKGVPPIETIFGTIVKKGIKKPQNIDAWAKKSGNKLLSVRQEGNIFKVLVQRT